MKIKINSITAPFTDSSPRFSWTLPDDEFSSQKEYTLTVAKDEDFKDIAASFTKKTDERVNIYPALSLEPFTKYFVKVNSKVNATV